MSRRTFLAAALAAVSVFALSPGFAADAPANAPIEEGTDYVVIPDGKPFAPVKGKVEVVEVFGYTCPHCAHFEPMVSAWKTRHKDVNFVPLAAPFGGYWMPYAKAYYTAQELGVATRTHDAVFKALHEDHALPISGASVDELATFYAGYGVDQAKFMQTFDGPTVAQKMQAANDFIQRSGVEGTPTLVVNGKYRVKGKDFDDVLRIADALVAREQRAGKR
jgi:thiol:disulfide interchange protein DsbA